ncbi:hypothetical protein [Hymenobacter volaticus]|uniref:Uncharacterized protein n=1 Tax=Hymenobacter volaticus TaxID=2932254 RepID=A0ABY4G805_9BACT|nr:hypothetical protein [Hymenobacter volaticus]UOQ66886.1 hypothetical protein MUN86_02930 [Hymenobacter volaticus]
MRDAAIKKHDGAIRLSQGCTLLKDSREDADYCEYEYLGDLAANHKLKVVRRQLYNGNEYVVIDARSGCKNYTFKGRPYSRNALLVNFDETKTTDRISSLEVWWITPTALVHVKRIVLGKIFPAGPIHFSANGKSVLFADEQARFWTVAIR